MTPTTTGCALSPRPSKTVRRWLGWLILSKDFRNTTVCRIHITTVPRDSRPSSIFSKTGAPISSTPSQRDATPKNNDFLGSHFLQSLLYICKKIVDMLRAYAQTHGWWCDMLPLKLLWRKLGMCGGIGMYHKALHIRHIGQKRKYLEWIDKTPRLILPTLNLKSEDASGPMRK